MTPKSIISGAIEILVKKGWQSNTNTNGITVDDALLRSFNKQAPLCWKASTPFGEIFEDKEALHKALVAHNLPYYSAKCLIAQFDETIVVKELVATGCFLFPFYIDLREWNYRANQTKEHIFRTLKLAVHEE